MQSCIMISNRFGLCVAISHLTFDGYFPEMLLAWRIIHSSFCGRVSAP
jgi:hypothetical protein